MSQITTFSSGGGGSGVLTLTADTGGPISPIGGTIIIAGGSNVNTAGTAGTITVNLDNTVSISGSMTAGTGLTATTGDVTITAGNLDMPATSSASNGIITFGGVTMIHTGNAVSNANGFVGLNAGNATVSGVRNFGAGGNSLFSLTSGIDNTGSGVNTLYFCQNGSGNVAVGTGALTSLVSGNNNVAIGRISGLPGALGQLVSGNNNLAIGYGAGLAYTSSESNNIVFSNSGVVSESNVMRLGTSGSGSGQVNTTFIAGIYGVTVGVSGTAVFIDNTGNLGTIVSSIRFKQNVKDLGPKSEDIFKLRPVAFSYKKDESNTENVGLIAEEVESVMPSLVVRDDQGLAFTVKYQDLPVLLLNEIQKLKKDIEALKGKCCG